MIGRHSLEPANCYRFFFDPAAATGRFAGPIANAAEDAREHVGLPIEHVRIGKLPLSYQADVARDIRMGRTGPLAIDDLMEILRFACICWLHAYRSTTRFVAIARRPAERVISALA